MTALSGHVRWDCGFGGDDQNSSERCGEVEKYLLMLTEDAMTGMKHPAWGKYEDALYARIKDVNKNAAPCIIGNIVMKKVEGN